MFTVEYTHTICMAHRLFPYSGKCSKLHGHNYNITFVVGCEAMKDCMVIDFGVIKNRAAKWLDEHWDHKTMLYEKDPLCIALQPWDCGIVPVPYSPTAEKMAEHLLSLDLIGNGGYGRGVHIIGIRVEETVKNIAVVSNVIATDERKAQCQS